MNGHCYYVRHPRRPDQDFAALDPALVARSVSDSHDLGWKVRVQYIAFHGQGALPHYLNGNQFDAVWDALSEKVKREFNVIGGEFTNL